MKKIRTFFAALYLCLIVGAMTAVPVLANPYGYWQTINGRSMIRCTYYAWQKAYERNGVSLPGWGNAATWYNSAKNAGYSVGSTPKEGSLAVWGGGVWINGQQAGHVAYVDWVNDSQWHVIEGGRSDTADGTGSRTFSRSYGVGMGTGRNNPEQYLTGFIYLGAKPAPAKFSAVYDATYVGETTARVSAQIPYQAISGCGVYLGASTDTMWLAGSDPAANVQNMWYDLSGLAKGTTYYYKFYYQKDGQTVWSDVKSFRTAGTAYVAPSTGSTTGKPSTVSPKTNKISAKSINTTCSAKSRKVSLAVSRKGSGKIRFSSSDSKIKVSSTGTVTIPAQYIGKAKITIRVAASKSYKAAVKSVYVTVVPKTVKITSLTNQKSRKAIIRWQRNASVTGYQIYVKPAGGKSKTINIRSNRQISTTLKSLKKGTTYTIRVRTYKTVWLKSYYSAWSKSASVKIRN